jgi:ribonuclease I
MKGRKPSTPMVTLAIAVIGAVVAYYSATGNQSARREQRSGPDIPVETRDRAPPARPDTERPRATQNPARADFDFYLLALSIHPAFCADGNERKSECRHGGGRTLTIHGLWPEKLQAGAYPHDCAAPPVDLEPALARDLAEYMPGMESHLHEHEWRKHGGCSGLDDDDYFRRTLDLARSLDAALQPALTTSGETTASALRAAADARQAGLGATFTLHCRTLRGAEDRGTPYLIEVRQCIDDDGPAGAPGTPLACAGVDRRDQGCGRAFRIAAAR